MTYNELVDAAKLRVRKLSNDALDEDVKTHVDSLKNENKIRTGTVVKNGRSGEDTRKTDGRRI